MCVCLGWLTSSVGCRDSSIAAQDEDQGSQHVQDAAQGHQEPCYGTFAHWMPENWYTNTGVATLSWICVTRWLSCWGYRHVCDWQAGGHERVCAITALRGACGVCVWLARPWTSCGRLRMSNVHLLGF